MDTCDYNGNMEMYFKRRPVEVETGYFCILKFPRKKKPTWVYTCDFSWIYFFFFWHGSTIKQMTPCLSGYWVFLSFIVSKKKENYSKKKI